MQVPRVLTNPQYVQLLSAITVSKLGDCFLFLTIPVLLYTTTHSARILSLAFICEVLPYLLWSLPGGVCADMMRRKTILVWGDGTAALLVLSLLLLQTLGVLSLGMLYLFLFGLASVTAFYEASFEASIADVGETEQLGQAHAFLKLSDTLTNSLGPALAGLVLARLGTVQALGLDAGSFLLSCLLLSRLRVRRPPGASDPTSLWRSLRDGCGFLAQHKVLRAGVVFMFLLNIGQGAVVPLGWLTDRTQALHFSGCFLVLKHKPVLSLSTLFLGSHRRFGGAFAAQIYGG
jgi:hypothetical protein